MNFLLIVTLEESFLEQGFYSNLHKNKVLLNERLFKKAKEKEVNNCFNHENPDCKNCPLKNLAKEITNIEN